MIIIIENKMENGRDYAKSVSTIIATNVTQRVRCNNRKYHELDKKDDDSCDDSCNTIFQKDLSKRKREREKKKERIMTFNNSCGRWCQLWMDVCSFSITQLLNYSIPVKITGLLDNEQLKKW